jgi:ABC-type sulfate/molybdate transport systems ATPase subunit
VSAAEPRLHADGLNVVRGGHEVIHSVELTLCAGEVVALLGPNGAGKSTLLETLAGSLTPSEGSIRCDGRIAVALQTPDLARRSVLSNVELALSWWGVPRGVQRTERAHQALALMGVSELADRRAESLSGGQRRRVHIARVLAVEPDVLLLDEPFAGLDGEARTRLLEDSARVLRSPQRATLVVVHDRSEAWALADRIVVLLDGRIAGAGSPRELLNAPPSAEVARFLGFDGVVRDGESVLLTRPAGVRIDPRGSLHGTVTRLTPMEDGARLEVTLRGQSGTSGGVVYAMTPWPAPELEAEVTLRLEGAVRFSASALDRAGDHEHTDHEQHQRG